MNNITKIIGTLPVMFFYNKLNKELQMHQTKKIAMNSTALFHASSTVILGLQYLFKQKYEYLIQFNSGGYFLFDFYYILKERKLNLLHGMYLYHHITGYLYMLLSSTKHYWPQVFLYSELSNIPSYLVYYSLKQDKLNKIKNYKSDKTKLLMKIQLAIYTIIRIFVLGYYGYKEIKNNKINKQPVVYSTSILYLFGCIWTMVMIKQNLK